MGQNSGGHLRVIREQGGNLSACNIGGVDASRPNRETGSMNKPVTGGGNRGIPSPIGNRQSIGRSISRSAHPRLGNPAPISVHRIGISFNLNFHSLRGRIRSPADIRQILFIETRIGWFAEGHHRRRWLENEGEGTGGQLGFLIIIGLIHRSDVEIISHQIVPQVSLICCFTPFARVAVVRINGIPNVGARGFPLTVREAVPMGIDAIVSLD
ncbi:MAG: hypothetical protein KCHDKBKB_02389 [Elusimicrobia bacterium]|nr:hypothetical protein [Elusimicrobiota bacterium]